MPTDAERKELAKKGFTFREYFADDTLWLIAASPDGHGKYWMELKR